MDVVAALFPSLAVALLFGFVVRAMLQGDRRERAAMAELDRQEAERAEHADEEAEHADEKAEGPEADSPPPPGRP